MVKGFVYTIRGIYQIRPLWKKQSENDMNIYFNLFFGLLGLNHAFSFLLLVSLSSVGRRLLAAINSGSSIFLEILSNFLLANLMVLPLDLLMMLSLLYFSSYFKSNDLVEKWSNLREETENSSEFSPKSDLIIYIFSAFILGYITGIIFTIILFIPYFILFITLNFFLLFISDFATRLITDIFVTWTIMMYFIVRSRLSFQVDDETYPDYQQDFNFSDRTYNILASGKDPVICQSCKSYIAATSKYCQVCGDPTGPESS